MELWRDRIEGSVVVIGNAPTALFHLLERLDEALGLLRAHPAMELAREHTSAVATAAQDVLDPLPDSVVKRALASFAQAVVSRDV